MKWFWYVFIFLLGIIPVLFHLHLVEKDFLEILGSADGIFSEKRYCFLEITNYSGIFGLSGYQARPPLIQILLNVAFFIFGHNLVAIYVTYFIPRLLILPLIFYIASRYFEFKVAYLIAVVPLFFHFFETYALSTLKADVFVVSLSLLAILFHLKWIRNQSSKYLGLSSFFLTLNVLSKETALAFSLTLWLIQIITIFKSRSSKRVYIYLLMPIAVFLGPFIYWSLTTTGKLFPSVFATAINIDSFPQNIQTYISSVFYYAGIFFNLSKIITITSLLRLFLILIGIWVIFKKKYWELLLPPLAILIGISFINTRVIQGNIVGNREILHRIAFIVPFLALYLGFGVKLFASKIKSWFRLASLNLEFIIMLIVVLNFIIRYFTAPFALDYTQSEFYVNISTIINYHPSIPLSTFKFPVDKCVLKEVKGGQFLIEKYKDYKTSAFPKLYQLLTIGVFVSPLIIVLLNQLILKNRRRFK